MSARLIVPALVALLPVLCFLATLLYLDSYKLVRLQAVIAVVAAGAVVAGIGFFVNAWLLQLLAIDLTKGKAFMQFDECWYCMPCEQDCPTGAVKVDIPYLLR